MLNRIITTNIPKAYNALNNPSKPYLTLSEEIPSDVGRSYEGFKRGGMLEGAEKLRKELMGALVWIAGIPAFQWLGDTFCEKALTIPMKIDFCKENGVNYIIRGLRGIMDLEYETTIAEANKKINPDIETIFFLTEPSLRCVSSTVVRDLLKHNCPLDEFLPENVVKTINNL